MFIQFQTAVWAVVVLHGRRGLVIVIVIIAVMVVVTVVTRVTKFLEPLLNPIVRVASCGLDCVDCPVGFYSVIVRSALHCADCIV